MTTGMLLAHVGPLGTHDLLVIIPMVVLSAIVMVVLARPRRPPPDPEDGFDHQPDADRRSGPGPGAGG
jgi:hypothetical protein